MTRRPTISAETEQAIIAYLNANDTHTWRQVSVRWKLGWPATTRLLHRLVAENVIPDRGINGRKQRGEAKQQAIQAMAASTPTASARDIGKALGVSQSYVSRVLRQGEANAPAAKGSATWAELIQRATNAQHERDFRLMLLRERWDLAQWHAALQREEVQQ